MALEFLYNPLTSPDSIRLIELQPSRHPAASIQCHLIHTSFSSNSMRDIFGHYTALSYVWGCADRVKTIWIDGLPLKITESLFSALHDLRDETRPFSVWADAICINQIDSEEKMMQIRIMGNIYANAMNTILYLGPADPESVEFRCIKAIRDGDSADGIEMIEHVLSKEWFNRVWVFQELVFSNNPWVQCGTMRAKWERICSAVDEIQFGTLDVPQREKLTAFSKMKKAWDSHRRPNNNRSNEEDEVHDMLALLRARRGLCVTDPRDMVFAHTGFAANTLEDDDKSGAKSGAHLDPDLEADYSKSCADVYLSAARHIIKTRKRLSEFMRQVDDHGKPSSRIPGLPSWVPDWTIPKITGPIPSTPTLGVARTHLATPGRLAGSILAFAVECSETIISTSIELSLAKIPHGSRQEIALKLSKATLEYAKRKEHWYDLRIELRTIDEVWPQIYEIWKQLILDDDILPSEILPHGFKWPGVLTLPASPIPFFLILALHPHYDMDHLTGRALARTSSGKLALVPSSTRKGDIVVSLFTSRVHKGEELEFVLRPLQIEENLEMLDTAIVKSTIEINFASEFAEIAEWRRYPVLHCGLIGQCILGNHESHGYWKIVAIH